MSFVQLEQVVKTYDDVVAADRIDLSVREGEFFALLGPSGCGKTTILRLIAGFVRQDSGSVKIGGERIDRVPPEKRNVGMVFQNYALFPHLTVAENIAFGLSVKHVSKPKIREQVQEMLEIVRLTGYGKRRPQQLSGGQQQRVALARALINKPSVLLLDEPLAALDKQLRTEMQVELRELQRKLGITAIFVTHDQEEAMTLSDRISVMKSGHIIQTGSPSEIYERPQSRFVSSFLGESNFFPGEAAERLDDLVKVKYGPDIVFEAQSDRKITKGQGITLAVRPEKVRLFKEPPALPNVVPVEVAHLVYMGTSTTYILEQAHGQRINAFCQNELQEPAFRIGEKVYAGWAVDSCFLLED